MKMLDNEKNMKARVKEGHKVNIHSYMEMELLLEKTEIKPICKMEAPDVKCQGMSKDVPD